MNIVIITSGAAGRIDLLEQTFRSLKENAVHIQEHTLTVVLDGLCNLPKEMICTTVIQHPIRQGASASRNIGASSIPKYRRQKHVMFLDDDVYMLPKWDERLEKTLEVLPCSIISGHAHPYNHPTGCGPVRGILVKRAGVLSTVNLAMPWEIWDNVGYFLEPGGPGGSEDVDYCRRAVSKGYSLAVTDPMCVVHCGLTSSSGHKIVGYDLMVEMNSELVESHGLTGKVEYA